MRLAEYMQQTQALQFLFQQTVTYSLLVSDVQLVGVFDDQCL